MKTKYIFSIWLILTIGCSSLLVFSQEPEKSLVAQFGDLFNESTIRLNIRTPVDRRRIIGDIAGVKNLLTQIESGNLSQKVFAENRDNVIQIIGQNRKHVNIPYVRINTFLNQLKNMKPPAVFAESKTSSFDYKKLSEYIRVEFEQLNKKNRDFLSRLAPANDSRALLFLIALTVLTLIMVILLIYYIKAAAASRDAGKLESVAISDRTDMLSNRLNVVLEKITYMARQSEELGNNAPTPVIEMDHTFNAVSDLRKEIENLKCTQEEQRVVLEKNLALMEVMLEEHWENMDKQLRKFQERLPIPSGISQTVDHGWKESKNELEQFIAMRFSHLQADLGTLLQASGKDILNIKKDLEHLDAATNQTQRVMSEYLPKIKNTLETVKDLDWKSSIATMDQVSNTILVKVQHLLEDNLVHKGIYEKYHQITNSINVNTGDMPLFTLEKNGSPEKGSDFKIHLFHFRRQSYALLFHNHLHRKYLDDAYKEYFNENTFGRDIPALLCGDFRPVENQSGVLCPDGKMFLIITGETSRYQ